MTNLVLAKKIRDEQEASAKQEPGRDLVPLHPQQQDGPHHVGIAEGGPGSGGDCWATMNAMMDYQSNKIHTGVTNGMERLKVELKTELQREREDRRVEFHQTHIGQEKLEQRLGADIHDVRTKVQNSDDLLTV